jgi:hypothetical protein
MHQHHVPAANGFACPCVLLLLLLLLLLLQARALRWKLTTRRHDGAGDGFRDKHSDLTPQQLQQQEQHLVQQVGRQGGCCCCGRQWCRGRVMRLIGQASGSNAARRDMCIRHSRECCWQRAVLSAVVLGSFACTPVSSMALHILSPAAAQTLWRHVLSVLPQFHLSVFAANLRTC